MSKQSGPLLGVNIDHVATLRQARGTDYPDPVQAALIAEQAGADSITAHLREDRRHIQDEDIRQLARKVQTKLNLEMAITDSMLEFALAVKPHDVCLVPEKRQELTTEGGLDVLANAEKITASCRRLADADITVSLFVDPDPAQIEAAAACGAPVIELHTGTYAEPGEAGADTQLEILRKAAEQAHSLGMQVNAGHGLTLGNTAPIAAIPQIVELNIGHAIICDAVFMGMAQAVSAMKAVIEGAR